MLMSQSVIWSKAIEVFTFLGFSSDILLKSLYTGLVNSLEYILLLQNYQNSVKIFCKITIGIVADVSVFFYVSGVTERRPVEEVARIFIEVQV